MRSYAFANRGRTLRGRALLSCEHLVLAVLAVVSLLPLYLMMSASLQDVASFDVDTLAPPDNLTLQNYWRALTDLGFGNMLLNSTILSSGTALVAVCLGVMAAFGFTLLPPKGSRSALLLLIMLMALPPVAIIIPVFQLMARVDWLNTFQGGILVESAIILPFTVFLIYSSMRDLPVEVFDAARADGASERQVLWHISLPLVRPALFTAGSIAAIVAWNDLLVPLIMWPSQRLQTLMVGLAILGPSRSGIRDVPLLMAGVAISVVPLLVLYALARRQLKSGLLEGSYR